jgi:HSP20 family protein
MTIVRYEPFGFVNRFHRDAVRNFSRFFDDGLSDEKGPAAEARDVSYLPAVDVREEENRFVVQVDLPGVESKDIEITTEKGLLTIKGERKSEQKKGTFLRRFTLPENAQAEAITAKQTNGVLEVSIPKQAQAQPKRIEVQAA